MTRLFAEHQAHVLDVVYLMEPPRRDCILCQMAVEDANAWLNDSGFPASSPAEPSS